MKFMIQDISKERSACSKMKTLPLKKFAISPMHSNSNRVAVQIKSMHKLTNTAEKRADWMHLLQSSQINEYETVLYFLFLPVFALCLHKIVLF